MNFIKIIISLVFLHIMVLCHAQTITLKGHVSDVQRNSLFAVNAYLLQQNTIGAITDLDGNLTLKLSKENLLKKDYMVFSFIGYNPFLIPLDSIDFEVPLNIILTENTQMLNEVVVEARKSITKEFSIKEMDRMQIYLSPLASADPLKAIAMLPSSTNTNETANPELRGSGTNRTKVFLNGVPVSNPVRNAQINGIGFFSLFNPEIIKSELVYPSNPPLIYGNTSAGMVDIETEYELESNHYQISASLATTGVCISQKVNENNFVQLYSNLMFSDGFLFVNPPINRKLQSFTSNDMGLYYYSKWSENGTFTLYNYLVSESSNVLLNLYTWPDNAKAKTLRDFTVVNFKYQKSNNFISINAGTNFSNSHFSFGNIGSMNTQHQLYISFNYKFLFSDKISMQTGLCHEYDRFQFNDNIPVYYYAMSPNSPSYRFDTLLINHLPEAYLYFRWKPINAIIWGVGIRKNFKLFSGENPEYLSLQMNLRYNLSQNHSLLFSMGKYHNITEPNYIQKEFRLLSANQLAVEYLFESKKTDINLAAYYKFEKGDTSGNKKIEGFEIYLEHYIFKRLKGSISNTILNSDVALHNKIYNAENDVGYFLVTTLSYYHTKHYNIAVSWSNRQGKLYTPVNSSIFNNYIDFYQPVYSQSINSKRFKHYNTINLSLSKMFTTKKSTLIAFVSIFNLLNTNNQKNLVYNRDYSASVYDYYQKRSIYFGIALSLK